MNDLIRRSDAIKAFEDVLDCDYPFISEETPRERIEAIPTAEPKRGKWIEDGGIEKCNQCGERKEFPHWNFCPNCGCAMTKEDE